MNSELEELNERHRKVMEKHERFVQRQRYLWIFIFAFLLFCILYSIYSLLVGEPRTLSVEEYRDHLIFIVALYSALAVLLVAQTALALRSRANLIKLFMEHFDTMFELGKLSAKSED